MTVTKSVLLISVGILIICKRKVKLYSSKIFKSKIKQCIELITNLKTCGKSLFFPFKGVIILYEVQDYKNGLEVKY